jgi:hypothetical protein
MRICASCTLKLQVNLRVPNWNFESSKLVPCYLLLATLLRSDLEASTIGIKDLKHKLTHSSCYSILSPPCEMCGSLNDKFFHATKENIELKQEVAYLTSHLERMVASEKLIKDDLSQVEEGAIKSTNKLGVGF